MKTVIVPLTPEQVAERALEAADVADQIDRERLLLKELGATHRAAIKELEERHERLRRAVRQRQEEQEIEDQPSLPYDRGHGTGEEG
jgi:prefoldin subunit 5